MNSSIATRTGDSGTTGLMYDRRVPKTHPQVEAGGIIDELSATLTVARAFSAPSDISSRIFEIQQDLVALMAELALDPQDWPRYERGDRPKMEISRLQRLDQWVNALEAQGIVFKNWNLAEFTSTGALLDMARTICRRGERSYWALDPIWHEQKPLIGHYLNRLSDVLWLLARKP